MTPNSELYPAPGVHDTATLKVMRRVRRFMFKDPLVGTLVIFIAAALLFFVLWIYAVYQIRQDIAILRNQFRAHEADRGTKDAAFRAELDTIYRTLYAPPDVTVPDRQPSQVELWQRNRDKELRDRINRLEQWRMREEKR